MNKDDLSYEVTMRTALTNIASWPRSMLDLKRMKNVVLYNPMDPLGLTDDEADEERILSLWGADPVHPTDEAYAAISNHLLAYAHSQMAESKAVAAAAAEAAGAPGIGGSRGAADEAASRAVTSFFFMPSPTHVEYPPSSNLFYHYI